MYEELLNIRKRQKQSCGQVGVLQDRARPDAAKGLLAAGEQVVRRFRRDPDAPGQDEDRVHLRDSISVLTPKSV